MSRSKKLTPNLLKQLVLEEKQKIEKEAKEVKAKDMANTLANKVDYLKVLKIHEAKLARKLKKVMRERAKIKKLIMKDL